MYVPTNSKKYSCKKCKNKIEIDILEEVFHSELHDFVLSKKDMNDHLSQADKSLQEKENMLETQREKLKELKSKMSEILELYHEGQIEKSRFAEYFSPQDEQAKQIEERQLALQAEIDYTKANLRDSEEIISGACELYSGWKGLEQEEKKIIVDSVVNRIEVSKDEIVIKMVRISDKVKYPPFPSKKPKKTDSSEATSSKLTTNSRHNSMDSYY